MARHRLILMLAVAAQASVSVVQFGLPAISIQLQHTLDIGTAGFGAIFGAVGLGSAVALIPCGMLVDRHGSRPVLLAGTALGFAGYALAAASTDPYAFSAAVFLGGAGSAAVPVAGMSALLREFPPEKRGVALGWRQLAVPLGGTIGAITLPLLADAGGVRLALMVAAVANLMTAGAFALLAPSEASGASRLGLDGVLSVPGFRTLLCVGGLYVCALGAALTYLVAAGRSAGLSAAQAGALFTILNVSAAAARPFWGRVADRAGGSWRVQTLAATGTLACLAGMLMPVALAAGVGAAVPVTLALAFGAFGFNGVVYVLAGELAGAHRAARAVGIASTVVFAMGSISPPVAGLIAEHVGYDAMWLAGAACSAMGAALAFTRLRERVGHAAPIAIANPSR